MLSVYEVQDIPFLRSVLGRADPVILQNLLNTCRRKCYGSGIIIFRQGDPADYACVVEEGEVVFFVALGADQSHKKHSVR